MEPTSETDVVLSAEGLAKRYGDREVVTDATFALRRGEVFGFLGPNGAGKTTTIRMLVGLVRPTRGRVVIDGHDLRREFEAAMRRVGCIVETPALYGFLTGRENLELSARMLGDGAQGRIPALADLVKMTGRLDEPVRTYSLGMRQRIGIAQALLGDPAVLILDEPTNGLDPAGIREMRELIRHLADERGLAVFVSSHILSEVERVADRVAIVHRGKTLAAGTLAELTRDGARTLEDLFLELTAGETV
jgi:ABC-2 type transport system ATP-binding protein